MTRRRKKHRPDEIVAKLRDADAMLNAGKDLAAVLQALEVSDSTLERWRAQYGRMKCEKASREDPDSPTLALVRADFIGTTGSEEQIASTYRELLERKDLSPRQTAVAANNLAFHLAEPDTAAEAEKLVTVAIAELGPHPDVLDTRGVVLLAAGKGQEAIADLKEALLVPTATKYLHLAAVLASQDQLGAARQALAEAKKRGFVTRQLSASDQQRLRAIEASLGE